MSVVVQEWENTTDQMWGRAATFVLICAAAVAPADTRGMNSHGSCRVVGGANLLAVAGGAPGLCAEVQRAIAAVAPMARYRAEVKVLPRSRLSTMLVVNGRTLPEQKFAVMDSELNESTIRTFAEGIATTVAEAAKP